jgi:hypothetical protein
MTTIYKVFRSNSTSFLPVRGSAGAKSRNVIVATLGRILPCGLEDERLVVLHEIHANNSMPMKYSTGDGTYICQHCGQIVNISKETFVLILDALSGEYFGPIGTTDPEGMYITVGRMVDDLPDCSDGRSFPPPGVYIQKIEEE